MKTRIPHPFSIRLVAQFTLAGALIAAPAFCPAQGVPLPPEGEKQQAKVGVVKWLQERILTEHDRNDDGELSDRERELAERELEREKEALLREFDKNDDGRITGEEMEELREELADDRRDSAAWLRDLRLKRRIRVR